MKLDALDVGCASTLVDHDPL